jgi:hypothetical protein
MTTNRDKFQDRLFSELEYTSIRDEILKRIELRLQIMSITLTLAGAFIGFGVSNTLLSLVYPPLAALLAMLWVQNDTRSRQLGKYIQSIEASGSIPGLGWESFYRREKESETRLGSWPLSILAPGGTFLVTELMAIALGLSKFAATPIELVFLSISCVALLFTVWLLIVAQQKSTRYRAVGKTNDDSAKI